MIPVWSPPDPYEPTSELYRLMPRGPAEDPIVVISPETPRWRMLAAKARPASRRALGWAVGLVTLTLAGVLSLAAWISPIDKMLSMWGATDLDAVQSSGSAR